MNADTENREGISTNYQLRAYEGPDDYIFVSYAHVDSGKVFPILEDLSSRGYRIWYDEGITPGSEWSENIARHLDGCALFLAFVTPNFMASPNCRKEVNFALSRQKPLLTMVLEPTKLPMGMELQLSAHQSVLCYRYSSEALFLERLCDCPDMDSCRTAPAGSGPEEGPKTGDLRRRKRKAVPWGTIAVSAAAGLGALMLMAAAVLLFADYHQENLLQYTQFPEFPQWLSDLLPGVWKELPGLTSPEFRDLKNLPAMAWVIAAGWFCIRIRDGFRIPQPVEKLVRSAMMVQFLVVVAHFTLCAYIENTARIGSVRWNTWMPLYFPVENLVVIGAMALLGYTAGRGFQWLIGTVLRFLRK